MVYFLITYAYSKVEHVKFWSICSKLDHVVFLSMLKVGPCCILEYAESWTMLYFVVCCKVGHFVFWSML